jgi:hypothetical protein
MKKILFLIFIFFNIILKAQQYSFVFYNDFFAGTDRHFTNGMALSWIDDAVGNNDNNNSNSYSRFMLDAITKLPLVEAKSTKKYNAGISISQMAITPTDTSIPTPQYDDIPYAGYLAASFYIFQWDNTSFDEFRIDLGVVGDEAGAEFVQNGFHRAIGNSEAMGWDTQLGTEYIFNTLFRHGAISWHVKNLYSLDMDWFNQGGFQVGNFLTDLFAGTIFRVGQNYIKNFNVHYPYLREESSMLSLQNKHKGFGWSFSAGANAQMMLYSYILDEAVKEGYDTEKNFFNISLYGGIDIYYELHKFSFLYQSHSPYTQEENRIDTFGGFVYSYQF